MTIRNGVERLLLGRPLADRRRAARETRDIAHLPDRRQMAEVYIPEIAQQAGRILWIGTRPYTAETYADMAAHGGEVWTSDVDPKAERWGRAGRHRTGDVREIDRLFADIVFDTVIFNGVVGFGVDTLEDQTQSLAAIARVLKPGGLLLFGWNTDKIDDPHLSGAIGTDYAPISCADAASRVAFPGSTHVYDALRRV